VPPAPAGDITQLLGELQRGDSRAADRLLPVVYEELRRLARTYFHQEPTEHTLQPTALVHEAYLRLVDGGVDWQGRAHFFGVAARAMRRILIDHARARRADKRGGGAVRAPLDAIDAAHGEMPPDEYLLSLDEGLQELAKLDQQQARVVEMRFFGGLNVEETAAVLDVSPRTVKRDWAMAKGWLHRFITKGER
jgi:RNA polymerase sigma factor (TIGR02999 family)